MQLSFSTNDLLSVLPAVILSVWGMVLLLVDLAVPREHKRLIGWLSMIGIGAALVAYVFLWRSRLSGFGGGVTDARGVRDRRVVNR